MVDDTKPSVRYSDPSHEGYTAKRELTPTPPPFDGPWIKPETLARMPNLARDFQLNRDPLIARQVPDLEAGGSRSGSGETKRDKPKPELKPPPHMRGGVRDQKGWLTAQRAAVQGQASMPRCHATSLEFNAPRPARRPER